jgi:hypothetical protein
MPLVREHRQFPPIQARLPLISSVDTEGEELSLPR